MMGLRFLEVVFTYIVFAESFTSIQAISGRTSMIKVEEILLDCKDYPDYSASFLRQTQNRNDF
jgi:hypothetical protein